MAWERRVTRCLLRMRERFSFLGGMLRSNWGRSWTVALSWPVASLILGDYLILKFGLGSPGRSASRHFSATAFEVGRPRIPSPLGVSFDKPEGPKRSLVSFFRA